MNDILSIDNDGNHELMQNIEIIPIDYVLSGDEIIETFMVKNDGSLLPVVEEPRPKKLTRKRLRNSKNWKRNISKVNRQSGKSYKNANGEIQPARDVKSKGCSNPSKCPFQCMAKINRDGRQAIFDSFWLLNDPEKRHFYVSNVKRAKCNRKRTNAEHSRKPYVLNYYFNYMNEDVRVCQQFFVNTLNVNKGRVYYYFKNNSNKPTITPGKSRHGTHQKKVISDKQKQEIRDHINRFPVVESHYCRKHSKKQYLYQGLNLATMYRLYVVEVEDPAKLSVYRQIFNYEFNLSFFKPKKDRCDKCMAYELLNDPDEAQAEDQNLHIQRKEKASYERKNDREISLIVHRNRKSANAAFDMENVFQLPISNASVVYYRRKFAVLNLTLVMNGVVYCAMWDESLCGREGTHIANALIKILKRVLADNPWIEHLTLWSDSCTPQNRNSIMSAALQCFLDSDESFNLRRIDQKFSEAGHGLVQEVDCAHSVIERFLRKKFIYSPTALLKEISEIPEKKLKFVVISMKETDYFDYQLIAHAYKYSTVPFTKVRQITYRKHERKLLVKLDFNQNFSERNIDLKPRSTVDVKKPAQLKLVSKLSADKISDIRSMFAIMPKSDRMFYDNVFTTKLQFDTIEDSSQVDCMNSQTSEPNKRQRKQKMTLPKKVPKVHTNSTCEPLSQTIRDEQIVASNETILKITNNARIKQKAGKCLKNMCETSQKFTNIYDSR